MESRRTSGVEGHMRGQILRVDRISWAVYTLEIVNHPRLNLKKMFRSEQLEYCLRLDAGVWASLEVPTPCAENDGVLF